MSMPTLVILCALYFGTVMNYPVISTIFDLSADVPNPLFAYTAPLLLTAAFVIIFSAFAWSYVFKPFMVFVIVTSAAALFASVNFHTLFDTSMMENVFETNSAEIAFYINPTSTLYLLVFGIVPSALLLMVRITPQRSLGRAILTRVGIILAAILVIGLIAISSYKEYASVGRNNKYLSKMIIPAHIFNGVRYLDETYFTTPLAYTKQGEDATVIPADNSKPTLMVVVLGETARAMNFAYNGYERNTNPYTQDLGLIAFQDVSSCGTYTALSVPCMFSNMTRDDYDKEQAAAQDNSLNVLQHAGVDVLWIDNDGGDKGAANHVPYLAIDAALKDEKCDGSTCFDAVMLNDAKQFMQPDVTSHDLVPSSASKPIVDSHAANKLLVLHTIGSHGPTYYQRYPDDKAPFQPACNRSDIEHCTDQEIKNVYDNTLVYTDYVLAQVVDALKDASKDYNVVMTYISDHGESLGEGGFYLHGAPYAIAPDEQTHVPWLMWIPEQYAQQKHLDTQCLQQASQTGHFSHDNLFDTLLGLYGVKSSIHDPNLDIIQSCRTAA